MPRYEYTIKNEGQAAIFVGQLRRLGFAPAASPGGFGVGMRLGSVYGELATMVKSNGLAFYLEGPEHGLAPIMRFLGNTAIMPGSRRPIMSLLKSASDQQAEQQQAKLKTARAALSRVQQRQAARQAARQRKRGTWRARTVDVAGIEGRLAQAGWQLAAGQDGLPAWTFGDATIAIRDADTLGLHELQIEGSPSVFGSAIRLITSGAEPTWRVYPEQVEAEPNQKSMAAGHLSAKTRKRVAASADLLLDATDEQLRYAIRKLSKSRRSALHRSLA